MNILVYDDECADFARDALKLIEGAIEMTHTTPEQARFTADLLKQLPKTYTGAACNALRSLADQLEAVTAELASAKAGWQASIKHSLELLNERDAYKAELENIANANPRKWDAPCNNAETFQLWAQNRARAAIAKEAK